MHRSNTKRACLRVRVLRRLRADVIYTKMRLKVDTKPRSILLPSISSHSPHRSLSQKQVCTWVVQSNAWQTRGRRNSGTKMETNRHACATSTVTEHLSLETMYSGGSGLSGECIGLGPQRISGSYPPFTVLCGILDSFSTLAARVGTTSKLIPRNNYGKTANDSSICRLLYNVSVAFMPAVNIQHCICETLATNKDPSSSCQVAKEGVALEK